jgi:hypothetical protein
MGEAERGAWRMSARSAVEDKLASSIHGGGAGVRYLGPRAFREKVRIAFGDDAEEILFRRQAAETVMRNTTNDTIRNSQTASRQFHGHEMGKMLDDAGNEALPWRRLKPSIGEPVNRAVDSFSGTPPDVISREVGRAMSARGSRRDALVQALIRDQAGRQASASQGRAIKDITRRLLRLGVAPSSLMAR